MYAITKLNLEKSDIFFSKNVPEAEQGALKELMGVGIMETNGKYLCLPSFVGRSKREVFNHIKDKTWRRLNGWKKKFLSAAVGRS